MSTVLDVIKANKTIMIAPSMSGAFALPYALTYPTKLAGLVLIAPTASDLVPQSKLRYIITNYLIGLYLQLKLNVYLQSFSSPNFADLWVQ